jgi:hypothetical protein
VLEKTLESPLESREIKPVNPKGIRRADLLEKTLMLGKIGGRGDWGIMKFIIDMGASK